MEATTKTAKILVKPIATGPAYQWVRVRGDEFYHPSLFRWASLPARWQAMAKEALSR